MTLFESKQYLQRLFRITRSLNADLLVAVPEHADQHHAWDDLCIQKLNFRQIYMLLQTMGSEILIDRHYDLIMLASSSSNLNELSTMMIQQIKLLRKVRNAIAVEVVK